MEDITVTSSYSDFKAALDKELATQAESFVKAGYLLKLARDTEILAESGYKNVTEFAQAVYGLSKDVVSRYIAINDRYSVGGYAAELQDRYKGYGFAKLAEMLTLPEAVAETLDPQLTKAEIREIKEEIKEEEKTSDIEVMMETPQAAADQSMLGQALYKYLQEYPEVFVDLWKARKTGATVEKIIDVLAPSGIATIFARVPAIGKLMISIRGKDYPVETVNTRSCEKESLEWADVISTVIHITSSGEEMPEDAWTEIYGESFPEKEPEPVKEQEVAPVQQKKEPAPAPKKDKPKHVVPSKKPEPKVKEEKKPEVTESEPEIIPPTEPVEKMGENPIDSSMPAPIETPTVEESNTPETSTEATEESNTQGSGTMNWLEKKDFDYVIDLIIDNDRTYGFTSNLTPEIAEKQLRAKLSNCSLSAVLFHLNFTFEIEGNDLVGKSDKSPVKYTWSLETVSKAICNKIGHTTVVETPEEPVNTECEVTEKSKGTTIMGYLKFMDTFAKENKWSEVKAMAQRTIELIDSMGGSTDEE